MTTFAVKSLQAPDLGGWMIRAREAGLKVTSRPGPFGGEIYLVKDGNGSSLTVHQALISARYIKSSDLSIGQIHIARKLQQVGLIAA